MKKFILKAFYSVLALISLVFIMGDCTMTLKEFLLVKGIALLVLAISANRFAALLPEEEV